MVDLQEGILEEFAEAQRKSAAKTLWRAYGWHWFEPQVDVATPARRNYQAKKQAEYETRDLRMRMAAGYRPTKWGRRLRAIAAELGIEIPGKLDSAAE